MSQVKSGTGERKAARLAELHRGYAIRFALDWRMDRHAARGATGEPTDVNLGIVLGDCARAPRPDEYPSIRAHLQVYRAELAAEGRCPHGGARLADGFYDCGNGCASADGALVHVYDAETDTPMVVSRAEAAAGMVRYARSLGAGSAACGAAEERALEMLRGGQ